MHDADSRPRAAGEILAAVLGELVARCIRDEGASLGTYVRDIPPMDESAFCAAAARGAPGRELRFAFLSPSSAAPAVLPSGFECTSDPTVANEWRNDARAMAGAPLAVVARGEVAKLTSIYSVLRQITSDDIRKGMAEHLNETDDSVERREMWDELASDAAHFPLPALLDYASDCSRARGFGAGFLAERECRSLHRLGILPIRREKDQDIRALLALDLKTTERLKAGDGATRGRLVASAGRHAGDERSAVAAKALRFVSARDKALLADMPLNVVAEILAGPDFEARAPRNAPEGTAEGREDGTGGLRQKAMPLDVAVAEALLAGDAGLDFFAKLEDGQVDVLDPDAGSEPIEVVVGNRRLSAQRRPGSSDLSDAMRKVTSEDAWGGRILHAPGHTAHEVIGALARGELTPETNDPESEKGVAWFLRRMAAEGAIPERHAHAWASYAEARGALINCLDLLVDSPLAVAANPATRPLMDELLRAYGCAMDAVEAGCEALRTAKGNPETATWLASQAVVLDILFLAHAGDGRIAVAGPVHPFHVYRATRYADIARDNRDEIRDMGDALFKDIVAHPRTCFPNIVMPDGDRSRGERAHPFVAAGSIGALPLFTDPTSRLAVQIDSDAVAATVAKMFRAVPYSAEAISVAAIDPPNAATFVSGVAAAARRERRPPPAVVRIFRTRPAEGDREAVSEASAEIERMGGRVSVMDLAQAGGGGYREVAQALGKSPAHLTFVFDPGNGRVTRAPTDKLASLSPLVMPRHYSFDDYMNVFRVHVGGNAGHFQAYDAMYRRILNIDAAQIVNVASGSSNEIRALEGIAEGTHWLAVSDHGIEPTFAIPGTIRLEHSCIGTRDMVIVATGDHCISERCWDVLHKAGLVPTPERIAETMSRMRKLYGNQMPLDAMLNRSGETITDKGAKALLGNLAVADLFRSRSPDCLVVSLDSEESRSWILGGLDSTAKRGDLLVIDPRDDGIVLHVAEVKAWESPMDDQAWNAALPQVQAMLRRLHDIFSKGTGSPISAARRDVLRDQVYRTLAVQGFGTALNSRYARLLDGMFSGTVPRLAGSVFRVDVGDRAGQGATHPQSWVHEEQVGDQRVRITYGVLQEGFRPAREAPRPAAPETEERGAAESACPRAEEAAVALQRELFEDAPETPGASPGTGTDPTAEKQFKVFLGRTASGEDAFWNSTTTDDGQNSFGVLVTGDPGSGKTTLLRALIAGTVSNGIPALVFDFKNDYAPPDFAGKLDIPVHDVYLNGLPFNPLRFQPTRGYDLIDMGQGVSDFVALVSTACESLGPQQSARLTAAVETALAERGFPEDMQSLIPPDDAPEFPTFTEVLEVLRRDPKGNVTVLGRISKLSRYLRPQAGSFEDFASGSMILKMVGVPDGMKRMLSEAVVARLHGFLLRGDQPKRLTRLIVFDEAWRIRGSKKLTDIGREGRAFGVGCVIGTQFPGDVDTALAGVLETKVMLRNREAEHRKGVISQYPARGARQCAELDERIGSFERGEGFIRSGQFKGADPTVVRIVQLEDRAECGYPDFGFGAPSRTSKAA